MTSFKDFQASRIHGDASNTYGENATGFTYEGGYQIADSDDSLGRFWLLISNYQYISDDLDDLERRLWADTRPQYETLSGDDLEHFARGYFALIGKRYDHDLCTIALGGKPATVRDIEEALDRVWVHPLYLERVA
jgi:hypothetical protein